MNDRKEILSNLADKFYKFGQKQNFSAPLIRSDSSHSEIYILNDIHIKSYALQIEVDWREYALFMYVVRLINEELPPPGTIYHYNNGQWCRKFIEEIYQAKHPFCEDKECYTEKFLYDTLEHYIKMIEDKPEVLADCLEAVEN